MKKLGLTLLIIPIIECSSLAQSITPQVVNIAGGTYTKDYYALDWSVGEMALVDQLQCAGSTYIITNGYIQPFTDKVTVNNDRRFDDEEIRILPNPTRDVLEINYLARQRGPVEFKLFDALGRLVYATRFNSYGYGHIERINMTRFTSGTYMLYIYANSIDPGLFKRSGSYKIVKIK